MDKERMGKTKRWILLTDADYAHVRVLAEKMGLGFSAYVRTLIKKDLEENSTRTN